MRFLPFLAAFLMVPAVLAQDVLPDTARYVSTFEQGEGTDLVMVYIMSQDCGPCHTPGMKAGVERAKILLQARAEAEGKRFSAIGVVKNYDWEEGIAFLSESGYFDEVIAGRSWFNTGVVEHCHNQADCSPSMPMIRVFEREVTNEDLPDGRFRRVVRSAGVSPDRDWRWRCKWHPGNILSWVAAGAPTDSDWASN